MLRQNLVSAFRVGRIRFAGLGLITCLASSACIPASTDYGYDGWVGSPDAGGISAPVVVPDAAPAPLDATLVDATLVDATVVDATVVDAALIDAALIDATLVDSIVTDAAPGVMSPDAGDAGVPPLVVDAGPRGDASDGALPNAEGGAPTAEPPIVMGCGSAKLYETNAQDPGALGPWPVGVKTLKVPVGSATLNVEVWYPAKRNSEAGKDKQTYDLRDWLPKGAVKVADAKNKLAVCECYRDLPLDTDHGPYPAMLYIHGLGSVRIASVSTMAVWASHGFIVVAADHPGDMLTDFLAAAGFLSGCSSSGSDPGDMATEARGVLAAMNAKSAGFDFFGASMDLTRIALGGHSQGGGTVASMANTPNVKMVITLAPLGGGALNAAVASMLQVTGTIDSVTGYSTDAYAKDKSPIRRHVGIRNAGHIDVTDLCKIRNPEGKTGIQVASDEGVCGALILSALAQCGGDAIATDAAPLVVNYATTAALEETLHCVNRDAAFSALKTRYPVVSEFLHTP